MFCRRHLFWVLNMLKFTNSTVFNVDVDCIVNTINCDGFMGKGLALEFALRYPELEKRYIDECKSKMISTGRVYYYVINGQKIINFPTKHHFKNPSQLKWIKEGLKYFVDNYGKWGIKSIAFPLLGTANGGLDRKEVEEIMIEYLSKLDIDVYICYSKLLEGKEAEMVKAFTTSSIYFLSDHIKLNSKQVAAISDNLKFVKRFSDILKIEGIGRETYKKIFNFFYKQENSCEQIKLF